MRVTPEMTTEAGGPLIKMADFIGENSKGIKIERAGDLGLITLDSYSYPDMKEYFDLPDLIGIIEKLITVAWEIRELYG